MFLNFNPNKVISDEEIQSFLGHGSINLGKINELNKSQFIYILDEWTKRIDTFISKIEPFTTLYIQLFEQRFVSFEEYLQLFVRMDESEYPFFPAYEYFMLIDKTQLALFIADKKPTFESYLETYKRECEQGNLKGLQTVLSKLYATTAEHALHKHALITGNTGSGKSELLKLLLHELATKTNESIVVIDPHGDLSLQLVSLLSKEDSDRLIYFDPFLMEHEARYPVINPLFTDTTTAHHRDTLATHLTSALCELLPNEFSVNMKTLLLPCISVLLQKENATLVDLQKLIKGDKELLQFVKSHGEHHSLFFDNINDTLYQSTKSAIFTKLQSLLNSRAFYNITCHANTINLSQALQERKIILFNLDKGRIGEEQSQAFGKLLMAQIKNHVMQQSQGNRNRVYLAIDEARNFVSDSMESIIIETRKYNLSLILSTQHSKQLGSIEDTILANVGTLFVGTNAQSALQKVASVCSCSVEQLEQLPDFHFWYEWKRNKSFSFTLDNQVIRANNPKTFNIKKLFTDYYVGTSKDFKVKNEEKPKFGL